MDLPKQPDYGSTASDSQAEVTRKRSRVKAGEAPQTRSQSQRDSAAEEVFGSQSLQRAVGKPDLRDEASGETVEVSTKVKDTRQRADISTSPPPRLHRQYLGPTFLVPGSAHRQPEVQDRQQEEMNLSYGAELPQLSPVRPEPPPVQQVKDLAEYVAEQVRRDLDCFRQEIHTRVTDAITAAITPQTTPQTHASRTPTRRSRRSEPRGPISPRSTPERVTESMQRLKKSSKTRSRSKAPAGDLSTDEEGRRKARSKRERTRSPSTGKTPEGSRRTSSRKQAQERGINMPTFKGTNWVAFQIKFATYCGRYDLDDEEKLERLKMALEDNACRVLYSRDPSAWTYKELMKALENRYGHSKSYPMVERELRRIRRKQGQTLQDLADEIREVSRKTHMDEDRREQLTRSAFMGALDDDNLMIHYIDKRDPERESLASALEIAERYERENGTPATAMTTRLDAAQATGETQDVAAFTSGPSPLTKVVTQNAQTLAAMQQTLQAMMQLMNNKQNTQGATPAANRQATGQVWPGSNYRGKNFIPNYKSQKGGDNGNNAQPQQSQQQQQQAGAANQQNAQVAASQPAPQQQVQNQQDAAGGNTSQQQQGS